ncbi:NUDIX domain-containing protein [Falsiroseomonas oryziterrae]|uniref:NUDIX domain-containing protein n=1 Tax=Falsiroseomonas oryziterrae TaxID=2911368 RepID=UPI001F2787A7|nr:NUDIX hydrolase [Roseomonas sp. NPKOSM-4]
MSRDDPDIVATGSRLVYENRWMRVREDAIRRRDGSAGIYGVVEKDDFVVVVPVHDDGSVTLVQQFRYPVGARHWELCQGMWGGPDADPRLAAAHELVEETGLVAATLTEAGFLWNAYGTMRQGYRIFLATGLAEGAARPEQEEQDLISRRFARAELDRMFREGEIQDDVSVAAWGLLLMKGLV